MTGIYYADLFKINGKGCMITRSGKSKTCRNYTGDETEEIGIDTIRLEKNDGLLYGISDPTMGFLPLEDPNFIELSYFVHMLDADETKEYKIIIPKEISLKEFINLAIGNILFGVSDEASRLEEFVEITKNLKVKCIMVPWCESMKQKGKLIKESII